MSMKFAKKASAKALLIALIMTVLLAIPKAINKRRDALAQGYKAQVQKYYTTMDMGTDENGQIAPIGAIGAIVTLVIGVGVITIIAVLMPGVAGEVVLATDFSTDNPFNETIAKVPEKAGQSFDLTWVAVLVVVAVVIISIIAGLLYLFVIRK